MRPLILVLILALTVPLLAQGFGGYDWKTDRLYSNSWYPLTGSTVTITGALSVSGLASYADISISDSLYFLRAFGGAIIPLSDTLYDFGSSAKQWQDVFALRLTVSAYGDFDTAFARIFACTTAVGAIFRADTTRGWKGTTWYWAGSAALTGDSLWDLGASGTRLQDLYAKRIHTPGLVIGAGGDTLVKAATIGSYEALIIDGDTLYIGMLTDTIAWFPADSDMMITNSIPAYKLLVQTITPSLVDSTGNEFVFDSTRATLSRATTFVGALTGNASTSSRADSALALRAANSYATAALTVASQNVYGSKTGAFTTTAVRDTAVFTGLGTLSGMAWAVTIANLDSAGTVTDTLGQPWIKGFMVDTVIIGRNAGGASAATWCLRRY